jgi:hypothetical protein
MTRRMNPARKKNGSVIDALSRDGRVKACLYPRNSRARLQNLPSHALFHWSRYAIADSESSVWYGQPQSGVLSVAFPGPGTRSSESVVA